MPPAPAATTPERVGQDLAHLLSLHGVDRTFICCEVTAMAAVSIAKTNNRGVLGTMNEFVFEADMLRRDSSAHDTIVLALRLARTPCSAIGYTSPASLLRGIVAQRML